MHYNTIITAEDRLLYEKLHKAIRKEKREVFLNKIKQKILGILAIGISVAELVLGLTGAIDEGGAFIFMLPLGIYAIVTKENILN